jgi:hypothetical protein
MRSPRRGIAFLIVTMFWLACATVAQVQAPVITAPPLSKIAIVGQAVDVFNDAIGCAQLTLQSKRGATVSWTLPNVSAGGGRNTPFWVPLKTGLRVD